MNDATIINELKLLNQRCNNLTIGHNKAVEHTVELLLVVRAYENLINNSWIMRLFLKREKVDNMVDVIGKIEKAINDEKIRVVEQAKTDELDEKDRTKIVDIREKEAKHDVKKAARTSRRNKK